MIDIREEMFEFVIILLRLLSLIKEFAKIWSKFLSVFKIFVILQTEK